MSYDEQYKSLTKDILKNGISKVDRTGVGTVSTFGKTMEIDISQSFPLLTLRMISFKIVAEETLFFLSGNTNTKILEEKGINIWKGNTSREFLDSRNLGHLEVGDMGMGYGHQWRRFGASPLTGVDQVSTVLKGLRDNPYSRRHVISAHNPEAEHLMALPPCHILQQYVVNGDYLDSCFYMRSNDFYLGNPYNIASYALLNYMFAKWCNRKPGKLVFFGADVHIYNNAIFAAEQLLDKTPFESPKLLIDKSYNSEDDFFNTNRSDLKCLNYKHCGIGPKVEMAV